eukprot:8502979-Lingulodinium_polyedra.AAC.1
MADLQHFSCTCFSSMPMRTIKLQYLTSYLQHLSLTHSDVNGEPPCMNLLGVQADSLWQKTAIKLRLHSNHKHS